MQTTYSVRVVTKKFIGRNMAPTAAEWPGFIFVLFQSKNKCVTTSPQSLVIDTRQSQNNINDTCRL
jgi:hypothetical protein